MRKLIVLTYSLGMDALSPFPLRTERLVLGFINAAREPITLPVIPKNELIIGLFRPGRYIGYVTGDYNGGNEWEIAYQLKPGQRGKGYMTEALEALKPIFRDYMHAESLLAKIQSDNAKSLKVAASASFVYTGPSSYRFSFRR